MKLRFRAFPTSAAIVALAAAVAACAGGKNNKPVTKELEEVVPPELAAAIDKDAGESLKKFRSTKELARFLDRDTGRTRGGKSKDEGGAPAGSPPPSPVADAAPAAEFEAGVDADEDALGGDESITNTQEAGVDEGGIVKTHGDHLVVLRRGRLFTVDLGQNRMKPISMVPANPAKGHDAWYDEMLVHDDTIVVVGFSYMANATEIGLFNIDRRGNLSHRDTFFLRSNDYYSSRNYASRLLGDKLVFYMPYSLGFGFDEKNPNLPGTMPFRTDGRFDDWNHIIDATDIYRPIQETQGNPVLHTVVTCDLGARNIKCDATGIIGPYGRNFYVSSEAVYVWIHDGAYGSDRHDPQDPTAAVYRLPLDGSNPAALRTWGAPVDQFSFKEKDGALNVLVMAQSPGDTMWGPEFAQGDVAMMRVPVAAMRRGVNTVTPDAYVDLPEPSGEGYAFQNRFVGSHLLYGKGSGWGGAADSRTTELIAYPFERGGSPTSIRLPHGVDRIEAMGKDAVVVGSDGRDLYFSSIDLARRPEVADEFVRRNAAQGELRSHGFFYKPDRAGNGGTVGLPIRQSGGSGAEHLVHGSAQIMFLDVERLSFRELGALVSDPRAGTDDKCEVSCVDWYGNARPIFYQGRIFALLGYELVEGQVVRQRMRERNRTDLLGLVRQRGPVWKSFQ